MIFPRSPLLTLALGAGCAAAPPAAAPPTQVPVAEAPASAPARTAQAPRPQPRTNSATCKLPWLEEPLWSTDDPALGDPAAPVTIVFFGDFQDPFTARVVPILRELMDGDKRNIRLVFRHYPLPFHDKARPAAIVGHAVFRLEGPLAFFRFFDGAIAAQKALDRPSLLALARESGVGDVAALEAMLDDPGIAARVTAGAKLAEALQVGGTPGFFVNGRKLAGAQPLSVFREAVSRALVEGPSEDRACARSQALMAAPEPPPTPPSPPPPDARSATVFRVPIAGSPSRGGAQALVTIVEFGGYQDPFSKRVEPTLQALLTRHGADLRVVWKDRPLPFHTQALLSATLAREALGRGGSAGFWKANAKLMASPTMEKGDVDRIAVELGFSPAAVEASAKAGKFKRVFDADGRLADDLQAQGTPMFFINGRLLPGAQPQEKFEALIQEELEKARRLVAAGTPRGTLYDAIMTNAVTPPKAVP